MAGTHSRPRSLSHDIYELDLLDAQRWDQSDENFTMKKALDDENLPDNRYSNIASCEHYGRSLWTHTLC